MNGILIIVAFILLGIAIIIIAYVIVNILSKEQEQ